jgi:hypothetical protein
MLRASGVSTNTPIKTAGLVPSVPPRGASDSLEQPASGPSSDGAANSSRCFMQHAHSQHRGGEQDLKMIFICDKGSAWHVPVLLILAVLATMAGCSADEASSADAGLDVEPVYAFALTNTLDLEGISLNEASFLNEGPDQDERWNPARNMAGWREIVNDLRTRWHGSRRAALRGGRRSDPVVARAMRRSLPSALLFSSASQRRACRFLRG